MVLLLAPDANEHNEAEVRANQAIRDASLCASSNTSRQGYGARPRRRSRLSLTEDNVTVPRLSHIEEEVMVPRLSLMGEEMTLSRLSQRLSW